MTPCKLWFLPFIGPLFTGIGCAPVEDRDDRGEEITPQLEELISLASDLTDQGQTDSSLQYYLQAYMLADSIGSEIQVAMMAGLIGNHSLRVTADIDMAQKYLTIERDILESGGDKYVIQLIKNYQNSSLLRSRKLDLPYALSYAMMAFEIAKQYNINDSTLIADLYCSRGHVHYHMLRYDDAFADYTNALTFLPNTSEGAVTWNRIALGFAYIHINRRDTSRLDLDSARYWLEAFQSKNIHDIPALADYEYVSGIDDYLNGEYSESISHFLRATEYYRRDPNPNPYNQSDAFLVLSAAYQFDHQYHEALQAIDSALIRIFGFDHDLQTLKKDIRSIVLNASKAEILADSGMSYNMMEPVYEAIRIYQGMDSLIVYFMKHETESYIHHQFYNNFYYYKRIQICAFAYSHSLEQRWLHEMHDLITAYKARSFLRDRILNDLSRSDARQNTSFKRYVENDLALENAYFRIHSSTYVNHFSNFKEINSLLRQREEIITQMKVEAPQILDSWALVHNISADRLLKYSEDHNTPVINYYIGNPFYNKEHIYILSAYDGKFRLDILDESAYLLASVDSLYIIHAALATASDAPDMQAYFSTSHLLYQKLVQPIIQTMTDIHDLVIIPDHSLHRLAFDALITSHRSLPDTLFYPRYLIEQLNITYTFSPNSLRTVTHTRSEKYRLDVLAMGFSDAQTVESGNDELPELPGSISELNIIDTYAGPRRTRLFSGTACTKRNFFKYAEKAACIHLSTHGTFDPGNRHSSMLYMRGPEGVDSLYQHELRYRGISPDLLVLSACDSGAGMLSNEEGMFSVGRAFQAAGTRNVISALWPLSDRASKILFTNFYEQYFNGSTQTSALREAKLTAIRRHDQLNFPAYWGALILHQ